MDPLVAPLGLASFLTILAFVVLYAQPGHRLNQIFAALFLLRAASTATYGLLRTADDPAEALFYARLTAWYGLATPLLLVALAGVLFFPRARRVRALLLAAAALGTLGLALAHALVPGVLVAGVGLGAFGTYGVDRTPLWSTFDVLLTLLEATLVAFAARACVSPRESALSRQQAALIGLAFAFAPVRGGAFMLGTLVAGPTPPDLPFRLVSVAALLVVLAALPRLVSTFEGGPRLAAAGALAFFAFLGALDALVVTTPSVAPFLPGYDTSLALVRGAFAAAAALALLRYGLAGLPESAHRRFEALARGGLALAAALLVGGLVLALVGLTTMGLVAAPLLAFAVLFLSPTPLGPLVARLTQRVRIAPGDPLDEAARLAREHPAPVAEALLGRYRVERELGRGASATVHLATDLLKGRRVVVKRFHAVSPRNAVAEARALAAVRHPRVVPLLDVERVGQESFLVLGHVPGGTARHLLDAQGRLPPRRAVGLALDVLEALEALHAEGIVHGDVKPENVLLDAEGRGVVGDLGSARFVAPDATTTGVFVGASLSTVAPEVLRGERPTPAADLYAAGATLYRLLTGEHYVDLDHVDAFRARERILLDAPRLPHPHVPEAFEAALRDALAKRPDARPADARAMADALRAALRGLVDEDGAPHAEHVART